MLYRFGWSFRLLHLSTKRILTVHLSGNWALQLAPFFAFFTIFSSFDSTLLESVPSGIESNGSTCWGLQGIPVWPAVRRIDSLFRGPLSPLKEEDWRIHFFSFLPLCVTVCRSSHVIWHICTRKRPNTWLWNVRANRDLILAVICRFTSLWIRKEVCFKI